MADGEVISEFARLLEAKDGAPDRKTCHMLANALLNSIGDSSTLFVFYHVDAQTPADLRKLADAIESGAIPKTLGRWTRTDNDPSQT